MTNPYDSAHQAVRRAMLAASGPADLCWRCGLPLGPDKSKVHAGHRDDGPGYAGLEHAKCNERAGQRKGQQLRRERERAAGVAAGVDQVAVAVEISQDRQHTSVVTAGYLPGELVMLNLASYADGVDPVGPVLQLRDRCELLAVVLDPHSPGATAIAPLEAARVTVTRTSSSDMVIAFGAFIDLLRAGRLRHTGQAVLTAGMRALEARRLGGAEAPERRGGLADVAPGVAGMLACWGLERGPKPSEPFFAHGDQ
jgi:hypothetical protein